MVNDASGDLGPERLDVEAAARGALASFFLDDTQMIPEQYPKRLSSWVDGYAVRCFTVQAAVFRF